MTEKEITQLQAIIYNGLMEARFKTNKDLPEILDETVDWLTEEHFIQEYNTSYSTKINGDDE